jgi:hypothetical protein
MLDFAVEDLGVRPKNVTLLVTEELFYKFVKHIPLKGKDKKAGIQYYLEAENDAERDLWLKNPVCNVPEGLLPAIKASFLCYSQFNRDELLEMLDKRTVAISARRDPTIENFLKAMKEFVAKAKKNPKKDFLLIQVHASHGFHVHGFQEVLGPYLDLETMNQEFIQVEKIVRGYLKDVPNAYCLVHFACCREIKTISDLEKAKLSKEIAEKLAKDIEEKHTKGLEETKDG